MKNYFFSLYLLSLALPTQLTAADDHNLFIDMQPPLTLKKQCAYQKKIASKPCTVSTSMIKPAHPMTKKFFGKEEHMLLTIKWPDGDTSRYALMDSRELFNLDNGHNYRFKVQEDDEGTLDTGNGVIILDGDKEHVRLW